MESTLVEAHIFALLQGLTASKTDLSVLSEYGGERTRTGAADRGSGRACAGARYADHLPLYGQAQMMQPQVAPVVARLREILLASIRIFADETVVPVLDPSSWPDQAGYF